MMGEVGFAKSGIDWPSKVMINFTWSKGLNEQLTPRERHAVLWFIEQGLMSKTGKRYEWEVGADSGDEYAELIQDFDWADEVLHARIGRDWYVKTSRAWRPPRNMGASVGTRSSRTGSSGSKRASPNIATGGRTSIAKCAGCATRNPTPASWHSIKATPKPARISNGSRLPGKRSHFAADRGQVVISYHRRRNAQSSLQAAD